MSWRTVTEDDLIAAMSMAEVDAFRRSAANDPIEPEIKAAVAYVRGVIRSSPSRVKMNADETTLPESLILPAMDYLRFSVLMRMNQPANESRTKAYENAVDLFREVRRGDYVPESDTDDGSTNDVAGSPAYDHEAHAHLLD